MRHDDVNHRRSPLSPTAHYHRIDNQQRTDAPSFMYPFMRFVNSLLFVLTLTTISSGAKKQPVDFVRDIKPILSDRCFNCHGPDPNNRQADLRLDLKEEALAALAFEGNRVIHPGRSGKSELIHRIKAEDPDLKMPPAESKLELTQEEIDLLTRWVDQGAAWENHWSFESPVRASPPKTKDKSWSTNEIDRFILKRLEQEGLSPSDQAAPTTLIRRLAFDLTGLPPTLDQVERFTENPSSQTYASLVDELLDNKHYGERMAATWLDVARYSDTFGYQVDRDRYVWPYRDWVIDAFNRNLPYDQFVTEQLAGDLLDAATDSQRIATTFNRLHSQKVEGGSVPEEFRTEYVADRTHTFGTAFLGITLECCRCHDHKYDPFTQKEYYQLFAYFNNIDEAGLYSYFTASTPTPTLRILKEDQKKALADIEQTIAREAAKLNAFTNAKNQGFEDWLANRQETTEIIGLEQELTFEDGKTGANKSVAGRIGKAVELTGDDAIGLSVGNYSRNTPFTVSLWLNTPDIKERAVVFHRSRAWTDSASRGYQMLIEEGRVSVSLIHFWPGNAIRVRTKDTLAPGQWHHLSMVYDGSSKANGLKIYLNGKPAHTEVVRDNLYKNITGSGGDNIAIGQRFRDKGFKQGMVDEFKVFNRQLSDLELQHVFDAKTLETTLGTVTADLNAEQKHQLKQYYLQLFDEAYGQQMAAVKSARDQRSKIIDNAQEIMVMEEMEKRRTTYVLNRGAYDQPADEVVAATPAIFGNSESQGNRLTLAQWVTSPQNPLTARVYVNRIWQMMFGKGLVKTPEDFGSQGATPTHPALLDWLALEFIESGWDTKALIKRIAVSSTYRQSSQASEMQLATDPENDLLSHANRFQLPAEMLRDNALLTSGLLVDKQGGPSVKPYEVAESFKPVARGSGEQLYRRSLYTYWRRTAPAPVMMTLDAAKREVCSVARERTSNPLHAIVLLNDPQYVEAARKMGENLIKEFGEDHQAAMAKAFQLLTSRPVSQAELAIISNSFRQQLSYFRDHPDESNKFLATGDAPRDMNLPAEQVAAMGMVINLLLNYDECVVRQ